jgi:mono/diheme cytochrome c family protein
MMKISSKPDHDHATRCYKYKVMKKFFGCSVIALLILACGGADQSESSTAKKNPYSTEKTSEENSSYDPKRGEGKWTAENLNIGASLDQAMADKGKNITEVKCSSCHKLTDERLVGPGWKGVTERRRPEWLMNFITNPDPMINKDPEVQAQLEICLVRMPNQNLSDDEARAILEYMRQNDGVK